MPRASVRFPKRQRASNTAITTNQMQLEPRLVVAIADELAAILDLLQMLPRLQQNAEVLHRLGTSCVATESDAITVALLESADDMANDESLHALMPVAFETNESIRNSAEWRLERVVSLLDGLPK